MSRGRARTTLPTTIRSRVDLDAATEDDVRRRLAKRTGTLAPHVARLTAGFSETANDQGRIEIFCRVNAELHDLPDIIVEGRGADAALALRHAADALGRTLRRTARSAHRSGVTHTTRRASGAPGAVEMREDDGSLVDRRVGHARENLARALDRPEKRRRDVFVDTSLPEVKSTDRKAGYGSTAARNTKRNTGGMQAALEDSRTTPSRKSTRRSANRAKAATPIQRTVQLAMHAPKVEATRAQTRKRCAGRRWA